MTFEIAHEAQSGEQHAVTPELHARIDFFDLTREELADLLETRFGAPRYRAQQIFNWVYKQGRTDFAEMSNLSVALRKQLGEAFFFPVAPVKNRQISRDGTRKYLLELER